MQLVATAEGEREAQQTQRVQRAEERRLAIERREQRLTLLSEVRREREDIALSLRDLRERLANNRTALAEAEQAVAPAHALLADVLGEQRELARRAATRRPRSSAPNARRWQPRRNCGSARRQVQSLLAQIADEGLVTQPDGSVRPVPSGADVDAASEDGNELDAVASTPAAGGAEVDDGGAAHAHQRPARGDPRARPREHRCARRPVRGARTSPVPLGPGAGPRAGRDASCAGRSRPRAADPQPLRRDVRAGEQELPASTSTRFFGGGTAELRIVEPETEDGEAGVDIYAQPPGKRIASLSVLSGGERSLTSVALLFALLAVNPAPVCVMDEVDAALDEANVGRFVETLMQLTARSQFIVITHNRRTVEAADTIYGVSMGEESTSQVLSLLGRRLSARLVATYHAAVHATARASTAGRR